MQLEKLALFKFLSSANKAKISIAPKLPDIRYMDQYHESQTAGKCIATPSPAKHDMSQARLYRINDYDVEQNYEKSCLASVPQQYLIHKQHKHLDISDQPKSNAILNAILLYAMQY